MDTRDRKFGGHLMVEGASLTFYKTAIDNLSAKLNLKATDMEIEQLAMTHKNDSLSGQGRIDLSHDHNYSGTLEARLNNLADYLSISRGAAEKRNAIPADVQATIDSSNWDIRGVIHTPSSSPMSFTANFRLPIGTDWNAFQLSPLNITLNFPSIFLTKAPQLFHPQLFSDGILSGNISLSETLQHPHIDGDIQLVNGKISGDAGGFINLTEANGRIVFGGNRASIEFLNVATKDTDLSLRGEIDFQDTKKVAVRIDGAMPIFDLTPHQVECTNKIEVKNCSSAEPSFNPTGRLVLTSERSQGPGTLQTRMVLLANFPSVSQVIISCTAKYYCWDRFRGLKCIPQQRLRNK
ncbi:MAG: hypothetical protein DME65_10875 [Verrucomicrobia bacterium]|nr:MAG: hypothetical protein DME65_10875 [Verrucomicrobiota bacterium]